MEKYHSREDYLKAIYMLHMNQPTVRQKDIVAYTNYSKPSISCMIKKLLNDGYIYIDHNNVELTNSGIREATIIYNKYSILLHFLIDTLHIDPIVAEKEADLMEHIISPVTASALLTLSQNYGGNNHDHSSCQNSN